MCTVHISYVHSTQQHTDMVSQSPSTYSIANRRAVHSGIRLFTLLNSSPLFKSNRRPVYSFIRLFNKRLSILRCSPTLARSRTDQQKAFHYTLFYRCTISSCIIIFLNKKNMQGYLISYSEM